VSAGHALALLLLVLGTGPACAAEAGPQVDPRAKTVFELTRNTRATYSNYVWNWVRGADGKRQGGGWSAEFHKGALHRVETPEVRVVADCEAGMGTIFFVSGGRSETRAQVANAACGINTNASIRRIEWVDTRDSPFGRVDRLRVVDDWNDRAYAVAESGALVASEIFSNQADSEHCVQNEAIAILDSLPAEDIFSLKSLRRSVVPDQYRRAPTPRGDLWLNGSKCP
jgi:hypothetical protein